MTRRCEEEAMAMRLPSPMLTRSGPFPAGRLRLRAEVGWFGALVAGAMAFGSCLGGAGR